MIINLETFKKRSEFIKAWDEREKYITHLETENHHLNLRLQEYEGIQTDDEKECEFQQFWKLYGKKGNLKKSRAKFKTISKKKKELISSYLPKYIKATPEKCYRKNAEVWLHNECWNDELPEQAAQNRRPETKLGPAYRIASSDSQVVNDKLRQLNSGINIKERLSRKP